VSATPKLRVTKAESKSKANKRIRVAGDGGPA
jgi:hypothetical protein